jgi:hypothetical protein
MWHGVCALTGTILHDPQIKPTVFLLGAQRLALPAWGGRVDKPSKRKQLKATKTLKKRGAYPKSGARIVSLRFVEGELLEEQG